GARGGPGPRLRGAGAARLLPAGDHGAGAGAGRLRRRRVLLHQVALGLRGDWRPELLPPRARGAGHHPGRDADAAAVARVRYSPSPSRSLFSSSRRSRSLALSMAWSRSRFSITSRSSSEVVGAVVWD